ncbi:MAG: MMPL family transporter [Pseudomonadota bacterium]
MVEGRLAREQHFVEILLDRPRVILFLALAIVVVCAAGLAKVEKDPSVDAFVPSDHPASLARDEAMETFGLEDPIIVGLQADSDQTAFTPATLEALRRIVAGVRELDGVKKNDVISLASENAIRGDDGDLIVDPILEPGPLTPSSAELAWARFQSMPMLEGLLSSADGSMLIIIIPVEEPNDAYDTVQAISTLADAEVPEGVRAHVAGVAAMNARLSSMVDGDTRIFVPAAILVVFGILLAALRRPKALLGPLFIVAGSAGVAIGMMGWLGAHYYLITTALPVVIMAIAVADSLHISIFYLRERKKDERISAAEAVKAALAQTWLPVFLTSVTTIAAFFGMSFGAAMQPISEFGLFAALGVAAACALSLTVLPAILVLTDLKPSATGKSVAFERLIDKGISALTAGAFKRPAIALGCVIGLLAGLVALALQAEFDYERQRYFVANDTVRVADRAINAQLGGINFLDVVVKAPETGGLMHPEALNAIADLRQQLDSLPLVAKSTGIDDYIALMHGVLTGATDSRLPTAPRAPGQYMFLYEASSAPEDFKQEIDYDYTTALIRAQLSTDSYSQTLPTVRQLEGIVESWEARTGLTADISGRVAVNDGWMTQLSENHFRGLGLAIALVFLTTIFVFRSFAYAIFAMTPVVVGVVSVYAVMGAFNVDIAPATSMTAAIATGLGVDFGIHLISFIRERRADNASVLEAVSGAYTVVARACFYSAIALSFALSVVSLSSAPPLRWFGLLVAFGAFGSLLGALVVVPTLWAVVNRIQGKSNDVSMA